MSEEFDQAFRKFGISDAEIAELKRRVAEIESGSVELISEEELWRRVDEKRKIMKSSKQDQDNSNKNQHG
jgi:hypothetical protein